MTSAFQKKGTPLIYQLGCLTLILAVVCAGVWRYVGRKTADQEKKNWEQASSEKREEQQRNAITTLANRNHAITDWRHSLSSGKDALDPVFSLELKPVLVNAEQRPILTIAALNDMSSVGDRVKVIFKSKINLRSELSLDLSCDAEQARLLLSKPRGDTNRWAVVALVTSVDKTQEEHGRSEDGDSYVRSVSYVSGKLVDFRFVGANYDDYEEILSLFK